MYYFIFPNWSYFNLKSAKKGQNKEYSSEQLLLNGLTYYMLIKLYTVVVYDLRTWMKEDNPSSKYIKGDN